MPDEYAGISFTSASGNNSAMSEKLVTRCPRCRTVFMVRPEQLAIRKGVVRCGRCDTVFRARTRPMAASLSRAKSPSTPPDVGAVIAESAVATAPPAARRLPSSAIWLTGLVVLVIATLLQTVRIAAPTLVVWVPFAQPWLASACAVLGCEARLPLDLRRMDLTTAGVTHDARGVDRLRVAATLVNRATHLQDWPALELTLSDLHGAVLARRAYRPPEYVHNHDMLGRGLPPGIAVPIEFMIKRPGADPGGYELRLISPY